MGTKRPVRYVQSASALLLVFTTICPAQEPPRSKLSEPVLQVARIIEIEPLLEQLASLPAGEEPGVTGMSLQELSLRQQITEAVVVASLEVDSVVDQIDSERAQIVELQSILLARRQRAIGSTNLATLALSTGLGALSGVLQFSDTTKGAGNSIGFVAGGISTLLSFRSFRQQHGEGRPAWVLPNMLGPFFSEPNEQHAYTAGAWNYLNSAPEGAAFQASRREQLLADWLRAGRFPALDSPQNKQRIALLTSTDAADKKLNLETLSDRAAMLTDIRDELAVMKRALGDILRQIKAPR